MKIQHALGTTAVLCLWALLSLRAPTAAAPPAVSPQGHSLAIPITIDAQPGAGDTRPAPSAECVLDCGPPVPISTLAFSPDGKTLAVGGHREVVLWDLTGATLSKRIAMGESAGVVRALIFSKDGQSLVVGGGTPGRSGTVAIVDLKTGKTTAIFDGPKDVVCAVDFSKDEKLLLAGGADSNAYLWNTNDKKLVATLEHMGPVHDVMFDGKFDGKAVTTASEPWGARSWSLQKEGDWEVAIRAGYGKGIINPVEPGFGVAVREGLLAVAIGGPAERSIWLQKGSLLIQRIVIGVGMPLDVIWAPKQDTIYVPCSDNTIKAIDVPVKDILDTPIPRGYTVVVVHAEPVVTFAGHEDWVYCVAVSADGRTLASGSADGTVRLWNAADGRLLATLVQLSPQTDQWLIITAQGHFAASSVDALTWKTANLATSPEQLTGLLESPEMVQEAIAGKPVPAPKLQ